MTPHEHRERPDCERRAGRHRRRRPGRHGAGDRARPAQHPLRRGRAPAAPAADPQGPEPDAADDGAFPFLGRGTGRARGAHDSARIRDRRPDGLRHAAGRLQLRLAAARPGPAVLFHGQRKAAAIRHGSGAAPAGCRTRERADAVWLERRGREPGRSRRAGRNQGPRRQQSPDTAGRLRRRLRRQPVNRQRARAGSRRRFRTTTG